MYLIAGFMIIAGIVVVPLGGVIWWAIKKKIGNEGQSDHQETAQEMADRMNREFLERIEREDKMPVLDDGTPNSHWYILEAGRLRKLGRDCQAEAILSEGYTLCRRAGMDRAAEQIKKKMR